MKKEFSHFDPRIEKIVTLAEHIKRWPLIIHNPLPTWIRNRAVIIGDAAHTMLPFGGQGANQAMEDGAAFGVLLKGKDEAGLDAAVKKFEEIRKNRTARVQILSSVRVGREVEVVEKLAPYLDADCPKAPAATPLRVVHDFRYVVSGARENCVLTANLAMTSMLLARRALCCRSECPCQCILEQSYMSKFKRC